MGKFSEPSISYRQSSDGFLKRTLVDLIEVASGRNSLTRIYDQLTADPFDARLFFTRAIELGELDLTCNRAAENHIPDEGPLVLLANHPFGVIDGLILCELAARRRSDFRIMLNNRLMKDDNLNKLFLPIDFDGTREAMKTNIETKHRAEEYLQSGGTLIVFPAGGVATRWQFGLGPLTDFPWTTFTAKLVRKTQATVVPVHFSGENSSLFHLASNLSDTLRLALFIREVTRRIGSTIHYQIGAPITYDDYQHIDSRQALTAFLQQAVDELAPIAYPSRLRRLRV